MVRRWVRPALTGPRRRLRLKIRDEQGRGRLDPALVERLRADLQSEKEALFVTLEGDSGAFCEGLDLSSLSGTDIESSAALASFADLLRAIEEAPRPVIAMVDGPALGGGVGLAAAADLVLASPHATFALPETLFGLIPAMVFPPLARRVGHTRARWLALSAARVSAREACRLGLVDEVADDLEGALGRHAHRLQRLDPRALAATKSIAVAYDSGPARYRDEAAARFQELLASPETRDRIDRYLSGDTPWPDSGAT